MKKIIALLISLVMLLSLCACGGGQNVSTATPAEEYQKLQGDILHAWIEKLDFTGPVNTQTPAVSSTVDITLSDALMAMLPVKDMDFLKNINLTFNVQQKDSLQKVLLTAGIGGKEVISADVIMDMANSIYYAALPTLSNQYLKLDILGMMGAVTPTPAAQDSAVSMQVAILDILEKLPTGDALEQLLNKYIDLILAQMTDVTKAKETITVSGVSQSVTVYTNKVTEEIVRKAIIAVLQELLKDEAIKGLFPDPEEYTTAISEALAGIQADTENDTSTYFEFTTYTFGNKILGWGFTMVENSQVLGTISYITVNGKDGSATKIAFDAAGTGCKLEGSAKAGYTVTLMNADLEITLGTLTLTKEKDKGSLEIKTSDFVNEYIFNSKETKPSLTLSWEVKGDTVDLDFAGYINNELLAKIETSTKQIANGDVSVPAVSVDPNDQIALQNYLSSMNFNKLVQNMTAAGIPNAEALVNGLLSQLLGSGQA